MSAALLLPVVEPDPFDPRQWDLEPPRQPVLYLDRLADVSCLIDEQDYRWAIQWRWNALYDPRFKRFTYARRCHTVVNPFTGEKENRTLWLHKEILSRMGPPPTPAHFLGDHLSGRTLDNRRANLRWATLSQNGKNKHGFALVPQFTFYHMFTAKTQA